MSVRTIVAALAALLLAAPAATAATRGEAAPSRTGAVAPRGEAAGRAAATTSPRRVLTARVSVDGRTPSLVVRRHGAVVLRADLGRLRAPARRARVSATASRFSGTYATVAGKRRAHAVDATRAVLRFAAGERLELAVADDGVAFQMTGFASQAVRYRPVDGARGWLQRLTKGYEGKYQAVALDDAPREIGYPALLADRRDTYTLLTETGVPYGQPGEHLAREGRALVTAPAEGTLRSTAGWRVAIIGTLADVVASDLPDDFATPSRIADSSWIRPGRVAWSWWADSWSPTRLDDQRDYVDFAARMGFEYVLVDAGWNAGWVPDLVAYAAERGVRVLLWTDWRALATPAQRAAVFDQWAAWGVAGVKADFLHSDSGERMAVIEDIAADAAARHLLVGLHGCTVPRGLQRTWPNVMTMEGVRGAEHGKSGRADDPAHNVTLAFTRNVIGSMDYTPVTFSAAGRVTSAAAQLAQSIVYESGLQHYADSPGSYSGRGEALELLREVPAAWDDTRLLAGAPGRSVTLARRSGERWFVGALSATAGRSETVDFSFLTKGRAYTARIYADAGQDGISVSERRVDASTRLTLALARHGGFAIVVTAA